MATIQPIGNSFDELQYPQWERQEDEKPKQNHMFQTFCDHGGNVQHWAAELSEAKKGQIFHGVELLYHPYAKDTLVKLATVHFYIKRRDAKNDYLSEYRMKEFDRIENEDIIKRYRKANEAENSTWDKFDSKQEKGELNGTQSKDYAIALNEIRKYKADLRGDNKKSVKVDVTGDVTAKAEVKTDFQRDVDDFQKKIISGNLSKRVRQKLDNTLNGD